MTDLESPYDFIEKEDIADFEEFVPEPERELPIYAIGDVNKVIKSNSENVIIFEMNGYLDEIWKSYFNKKDNIMKQFEADFPRHSIYINHVKMKDMSTFHTNLQTFRLKRCMDLMIEDIELLTIMLCNQSSFQLPFSLLNQIYTDEKKQIFLTYKQGCDNVVRINSNDDSISFVFETVLRIIDIDNSNEISSIPIKLKFDIPDVITNMQLGILDWKLITENKKL